MSTLTKILIVLLTLSSFFLCGIVVTYIANADNFSKKYDTLKLRADASREKEKNAKKQLNENISKTKQSEDQLNKMVSSLQGELDELQAKFNNSEREKATLLQKVNSWTSITQDFYQTTDKQGQLLANTLSELNKLQADQIKDRKELDETSAYLREKMAIIEALEAEKKRLLEEKSELQARLDQLLQPFGKTTARFVPVTPEVAIARQAATTESINLQGLVTSVDLKNSMASISIGISDGVKEGMKFHVSRGDRFICDILIIDIKAEEAVGILELVQQQPRIGDSVATNL